MAEESTFSGNVAFRAKEHTETLVAIERRHGWSPGRFAELLTKAACEFYKKKGWFSFPVKILPEIYQVEQPKMVLITYDTGRVLMGLMGGDEALKILNWQISYTSRKLTSEELAREIAAEQPQAPYLPGSIDHAGQAAVTQRAADDAPHSKAKRPRRRSS